MSQEKEDTEISPFIKERTKATFDRARSFSSKVLEDSREFLRGQLLANSIDPSLVCFIAAGSVGRMEALDESDLDLIPVVTSGKALQQFKPIDQAIRKALGEHLNIKVSAGQDLTQCVSLEAICDKRTIGGDTDSSSALTKRILILTEGRQAGGDFPISKVREKTLDAYAEYERTSGRHVLSMCNDIARYFRTLCIEYTAKIDTEDKDWSTRNLKLRHSRKFWYFSTIIAVAALATHYPRGGTDEYKQALLETFDKSPLERLFGSLKSDEDRALAGPIVDHYAWFLDYMSKPEQRKQLEVIAHSDRLDFTLPHNPFPFLRLNSDLMHHAMLRLVDDLPSFTRQKVFDWFLL